MVPDGPGGPGGPKVPGGPGDIQAPGRLLTGYRVWVSPGALGSPDRSCQEPVSTARRHQQFANVAVYIGMERDYILINY